MSIFEWPEPMLKAVVAEGLESLWKNALELPTAEARGKAKQKIYNRVAEDFRGFGWDDSMAHTIAYLYLEVGPLLAEHRAISKAAKKMSQIRNVAPEVLTPEEAVELMRHETLAPPEEWQPSLQRMMRSEREMRSAANKLHPAWIPSRKYNPDDYDPNMIY